MRHCFRSGQWTADTYSCYPYTYPHHEGRKNAFAGSANDVQRAPRHSCRERVDGSRSNVSLTADRAPLSDASV